MARVVLIGNLAQVTGGVAAFDLSARSVKELFAQLTALHPALGRHLEDGVAVAIDGQIYQDSLLEPIGADSEVFVLPQIAGGARSGGETEGEVDRDGKIRTHVGDHEQRADREIGMGLRRDEDLGRCRRWQEPGQGEEGNQRASDALHRTRHSHPRDPPAGK